MDVVEALTGVERAVDGLSLQLRLVDELLVSCPYPIVLGNGRDWLRVGKAFANSLGYTAEEMERRSFADYMHPADVAAVRGELHRVLMSSRATGRAITRYRQSDGRYRHFSWTWSAPMPSKYSWSWGEDLGVEPADA